MCHQIVHFTFHIYIGTGLPNVCIKVGVYLFRSAVAFLH